VILSKLNLQPEGFVRPWWVFSFLHYTLWDLELSLAPLAQSQTIIACTFHFLMQRVRGEFKMDRANSSFEI